MFSNVYDLTCIRGSIINYLSWFNKYERHYITLGIELNYGTKGLKSMWVEKNGNWKKFRQWFCAFERLHRRQVYVHQKQSIRLYNIIVPTALQKYIIIETFQSYGMTGWVTSEKASIIQGAIPLLSSSSAGGSSVGTRIRHSIRAPNEWMKSSATQMNTVWRLSTVARSFDVLTKNCSPSRRA